ANPPFLFGSGGIELLGKEMTSDLQALKRQAEDNPGQRVDLISKGLSFGSIIFEDGALDLSDVRGVDHDLVVKPFGRKGEFPTVRAFDLEAVQFHFGMQPTELIGENVDADGDGVVNEFMPGDLSALHIFNTTLKRPVQENRGETAEFGRELFATVGCVNCHVPVLNTERRTLPFSFPEITTDPFANEFFSIDLAAERPGFDLNADGGVAVPLFSDLRRHNLGEALTESFGKELDPWFITARLWGIADTAPYMHDGRALTIRSAILLHGGEAQTVRDNFADLSEADQDALIEYLRSLRTPLDATSDLE
ncbi:MAG: di-heme oxidoredictase family protein, partial [Phycisphaerae bacterium]